MTFIFEDEDTKISQTRPILIARMKLLIYSPRLLIDEQIMKSYQKARSQLSKLLNDKKFELKFKNILIEYCMDEQYPDRILKALSSSLRKFNPKK